MKPREDIVLCQEPPDVELFKMLTVFKTAMLAGDLKSSSVPGYECVHPYQTPNHHMTHEVPDSLLVNTPVDRRQCTISRMTPKHISMVVAEGAPMVEGAAATPLISGAAPLVATAASLATGSTDIFLVEGASLGALVVSPDGRGRCWCHYGHWRGSIEDVCGPVLLQQKPIYSHN